MQCMCVGCGGKGCNTEEAASKHLSPSEPSLTSPLWHAAFANKADKNL